MTWAELEAATATYLALAAAALAIGAAVGVPLGMAAAHVRAARTPVLLLANLARVTPSLALLTFMLPLLGVGFAPALAALAILATAPILITTDLAFRAVPAAAIDAARGMGMTPLQVLLRVEWPLSFTLVFAGIRTAANEVVASAVLAAFIGAGGLGELITTGLQADQPQRLWTGVVIIAAIALATEYALAFAQRRFGEKT